MEPIFSRLGMISLIKYLYKQLVCEKIGTLDLTLPICYNANMLSQRQEKLLNIIIDNYIKTAEPVSSKALVKSGPFSLSSATLRSEMNSLENMGYLAQLHTSGGRIPTDKAYRYFVDNLLDEESEPTEAEKRKIKSTINNAAGDIAWLNRNIARLLSDLSENVVITNVSDSPDFYKIGLASLFEFPEFREIEKMFEMANLFDRFDSIFSKIERYFFSQFDDDFNIFIGEENPLNYVRSETMIMSKYKLSNRQTGTLTLIGPTRMNYRKNIGLVKYTTEKLNQAVRQI